MGQDVQTVAALFGQGRLAEAEQLARKITRRNHCNGMAWKALAVAIKLQGRTTDSLEPMKTAAAQLPGDPEAQNNFGTTLKELWRLDEAEASYRRAIQIKPRCAEALNNLGSILCLKGLFQEAKAMIELALKIKPDYAEA